MRSVSPHSLSSRAVLVASAAALLACGGAPKVTATSPSAPAAAPLATRDSAREPTFTAEAMSPLGKVTPLQIVSFFAYQPNETLIAPANDLAGFIAKARSDGFGQEPLKTLLLDPAPPPAKANKLLYVALGPREQFSLERIKAVGATAMRESMAMKVPSMAFAPVARDQGVTTYGADDVAAAFVEGALVEFAVERRANPAAPVSLQDVTYEAGAQYVDSVAKAVLRGVDAAHRNPAYLTTP